MLELQRPLVFFDLETTGIDVTRDKIIQIAMLRLDPDSGQAEFCELINPEMPIPAEAAAIHGIHDADVADSPNFASLAADILTFIGAADLAGYNILRFDLPLLQRELVEAGSQLDLQSRDLLDVYQIFRKREPHTLSKAMEFYCQRPLVDAHDAMVDVKATLEVLQGQMVAYPDLPQDVSDLDREFSPSWLNEKLGRAAKS